MTFKNHDTARSPDNALAEPLVAPSGKPKALQFGQPFPNILVAVRHIVRQPHVPQQQVLDHSEVGQQFAKRLGVIRSADIASKFMQFQVDSVPDIAVLEETM